MRYVLIRPVGRTRLLVAKLVSVMAFVLLDRRRGRRDGVRRRDRCCSATQPARGDGSSVSGTSLSTQELLLAHGARAGLRDAVDARRGGDRAVPVDGRRVAVGGGARHDRRPHRVDPAAHAGRGHVAAALPADALLAVVRRPVPRPDPVAQRRAAARAAAACTSSCSSAPAGPTSRRRTSRTDDAIESVRRCRPRRPGPQAADGRARASSSGSRPGPRAVRRARSRAPGQTDCTEKSRAPSSDAESGGTTVWSSVVQIETHSGPSGVSSPRSARAAGRCPVASC